MFDLSPLTEAVVKGQRAQAVELSRQALAADVPPLTIVEQGLVPGMAIVGDRFKRNEIFVPEMLIAARAMKEAMALLEPLLVASGFKPRFTAVIGTVQGDLHDIGKNLVAMMWKGANFGVVDLGTNVPPQRFVDAVRQHNAQVIGLSALLTTTMPAMKATIDAVRHAGLHDVRVVIGGAPITREFAEQIGADGFAPDAASAVNVVQELMAACA